MEDPNDLVQQLAEAYGIATDSGDWQSRHVLVPSAIARSVLAGLDLSWRRPT